MGIYNLWSGGAAEKILTPASIVGRLPLVDELKVACRSKLSIAKAPHVPTGCTIIF